MPNLANGTILNKFEHNLSFTETPPLRFVTRLTGEVFSNELEDPTSEAFRNLSARYIAAFLRLARESNLTLISLEIKAFM